MDALSLPGPTRGRMAKPGASALVTGVALMLGGALCATGLALKGAGLEDDFGIADLLVGVGGAAAGGALLRLGGQAVARFARKRLGRDPGPMWSDHAWPLDGVQRAGTLWDAAGSAAVIALSALAGGLLPGSYFDLGGDAALVLFVVGAPLGGWLAWLLGGDALDRYRRYGVSRLRLPPGPLAPGASVFAELETKADLEGAELELRCVREEVVGAGKKSRFVRRKVALGRVGGQQATTAGLQFSLAVPEDAPTNALKDSPAVYWELHVRQQKAGYEAYFPVPVYPRPPALR